MSEHEGRLKSHVEDKGKIFFLTFNAAQERFLYCRNKEGRTPRRRLFEAGNKSGKTMAGLAEDLAHAWGYRPWLDDDDPNYRVDVPVPNQGLIGCETMTHSVMEKIWPELRDELIPFTCKYKPKKNAQGYVQRLSFLYGPCGERCGSEIFIRSYDQEPDTFEGIDAHWIHWDEPPPKPIIQAAERGKIVSNAPSWFTMTPLKEAYIYDEYSQKALNMGGDDDEIYVVRGEIWENCRDWCLRCRADVKEAKQKRGSTFCPRCNGKLGFIPKAGIVEYLKTLDPEEREAREKGLWHHLSGLVYKVLDRDAHIYEDFSIPRSWMKVEGMDPHDAKETPYLFAAVSPEEIEIQGKKRNRIYVYDYLLLQGNLDEFVRQVQAKRAEHGYQKPAWVVMDAKYGERTEMEGRSWEDELRRRGLGYIKLSQSRPGDVELGHKLVREYLRPQYSTLLDKTKPGLLFAAKKCAGKGGPIHQMFNYQYNPKQDKPTKDFKDIPDIVRYIVLEAPMYRDPGQESKVVDILDARREAAYGTRRRSISR